MNPETEASKSKSSLPKTAFSRYGHLNKNVLRQIEFSKMKFKQSLDDPNIKHNLRLVNAYKEGMVKRSK